MFDNTDAQDTLLLVIKESDGVIAEYQRQLYEASLLGIERVYYCLCFDLNENRRLDDALEKLKMVCDILNMEVLDRMITIWNSSMVDSRIVKTNSDGIICSVFGTEYFSKYKETNIGKLQDRERVGKVMAKAIAKEYKSKKVSSIN